MIVPRRNWLKLELLLSKKRSQPKRLKINSTPSFISPLALVNIHRETHLPNTSEFYGVRHLLRNQKKRKTKENRLARTGLGLYFRLVGGFNKVWSRCHWRDAKTSKVVAGRGGFSENPNVSQPPTVTLAFDFVRRTKLQTIELSINPPS